MAPLLIFVIFVISLALQGSVLALAGPAGVQPDILLVVTVALALLADLRRCHCRHVLVYARIFCLALRWAFAVSKCW